MTAPLLSRLKDLAENATKGTLTTEKPKPIASGPAKGFADREAVLATPGRQIAYRIGGSGGMYPANDLEFAVALWNAFPSLVAQIEAADRLAEAVTDALREPRHMDVSLGRPRDPLIRVSAALSEYQKQKGAE